MTDRQAPIHFWLPDGVDADLLCWNPDAEPERYQTGIGHAIIELFRRLGDRGLDVTIGSEPPPGAHLVFHLTSVYSWRKCTASPRELAQLYEVLAGGHDVTIIRGDVPLSFRVDLPRAIEVMPNMASIARSDQVWVPLLPQRGLVPRPAERYGALRAVGIMANAENVPAQLLEPAFERALGRCGVAWRPRLRRRTGPNAWDTAPWHDFSDLDAVVCLSCDPRNDSQLRKPATKLINAWVAGAVPLVPPQPSYVELMSPGENVAVAASPEAVLGVVAELASDPEMFRRLEAGAIERGSEFSHDRVLAKWVDLLRREESPSHRRLDSYGLTARAASLRSGIWLDRKSRAARARAKGVLSAYRRA